VLLAIHNEDGALGFVVNRVAPISVGELLDQAGYGAGHDDPAPVWLGGPVQPQSGWIVIEDPSLEPSDGLIEVGARVRVSSSREIFDQLAHDVEHGSGVERRRLVLLGYSGWASEQLEGEIARGAWLPTPMDETILFEVEPAKRWEAAYALLGLTPSHVLSMRTIGQA
jgi:putative transcriptional regulator